MMKRFIAAAALLAALASPVMAQDIYPNRYGAIVVEADTGKILFADHADRVLHPASLTKMMTLYMTFSALRSGKLDEQTLLPVSSYATAAAPTKLNLRVGDQIPVKDAILGLVTRSANDAARVLAEALGGSETRFAQMMTQQARNLGMKSTVFRNASGLPNPQQVSTPKDMAILARAIIAQFPEYYEYFSQRSFAYRGVTYTNHNRLMERYPGMDGMKTGYVAASGFNLVSSAVQGGTRLIGVVFGGRSAALRDNHMASLLDRTFADASNQRSPFAPRNRFAQNTAQESLPTLSDQPDMVTGGQDMADNSQQNYPSDRKPLTDLHRVLARVAAEADDPTPENEKPELIAASVNPNTTKMSESKTNLKMARGNWGVQLGAFRSKKDAKLALRRAQKNYRNLKHASALIAAAKTKGGVAVYHARLIGLTQSAASQACSALQARGRNCTPLKPTG